GLMSAHFSRRDVLKLLSLPPLLSLPGIAEDSAGRTAWYRAAKFGMFIHWGPYSLASVEASWPIMRPNTGKPNYISEADYRKLPARFNPVKFDPHAFVRLARAAGQRYMVFTTKHHDGFCMFDSHYTNYKITKTPYGKDIVQQLAGACREEGMPLGFYYSPPDMNHPAFRDTSKPAGENWNGQPERPEWPLYLDYMSLQLSELLTRYGPVALIWFDGLGNQGKYDGQRFLKLIHELQPATLVNNRIGVPADYETPEQFIPKAIPTRHVRISGTDPSSAAALAAGVPKPEDFRLWETCMTINNTWAYNKNDLHFKSSTELIRNLVEVASRGGNFLLNVGPEPDGSIQPEFEERLRAIGKWLDRNGEAIYDTTYGPLQGVPSCRTTARGPDVFLHILDWPGTTLEVPAKGLPKLRSASLLDSGAPIEFRQSDQNLTLQLPAAAPDKAVTVIALRAA
ncbi:MAG: alpha-L-fucosidase, partial [Bryobacterales bacterium]|nr:alpha-L-fucosidase [Bryobacterales bacterium]